MGLYDGGQNLSCSQLHQTQQQVKYYNFFKL